MILSAALGVTLGTRTTAGASVVMWIEVAVAILSCRFSMYRQIRLRDSHKRGTHWDFKRNMGSTKNFVNAPADQIELGSR